MVAIFTISNLLYFTVGVHIINRHAALWPVFRIPMVIATFVGFAFAILHPPIPDWLMLAIKMTGDAMIPLMLISLGVRMATVSWGGWNLGVTGALICPPHRHRHGGAARTARARARSRSRSAGAADSFRLPAACRAQLHGRRAI